MAESLDDAKFWLPPQFLADEDDVVFPENSGGGSGLGLGPGFGFPFEVLGASSDLSSPVESVVGSSEAESDEDDFLARLNLQMTRSALDDRPFAKNDAREAWNLSGSPQSTLCSALGGCGGQSSSRGSPNAASSRVSSPPPPATWDLLSAAAGEVAKIRSSVAAEEEEEKLLRGHGGPFRNPSSDLNRRYQFEQLRQIQILKQQHLQQLRFHQIHQQQQQYQSNKVRFQSHNPQALGLPNSAWPTLQQAHNLQNGSGMRAIFLGNPSPGKRECAGTGVFLPRQPGAQPETRKKPGCSTVLLPARVVQALNLNLDEMGNQVQPRFNGRVAPEADTTSLRFRSNNYYNNNYNNNNVVSYQNRNVRPQKQVNHHEIRLPQDWTY